MKDALYEILGEVNEIKDQLDSMLYLLEILEEIYASQNTNELHSLVKVIKGYLKSVEVDFGSTIGALDKIILQYKNV